ncbi:MAG: ATP-binding protein [Mycobacterium sp.]
MFAHPTGVGDQGAGFAPAEPPAELAPAKRPSRLSPANWPVRWRVFAIALVPLLLAAVFGGLRVYASANEASDLRLAAQRVQLVPAVDKYMAALETALVTLTAGGDGAGVMEEYNTERDALEQRLNSTSVVDDVRLSVNTLLNYGQELLTKVQDNSIDLRQRVTTYTPLLLTAETAITGSVGGSDAEDIRVDAEGLARAVGARGQMALEQMLVDRGGDVPEPELRAALTAIIGTEPSTVTGMSKVLGAASDEATTLRSQTVQRISILSDPTSVLIDNPDFEQSIQTTDGIARGLIDDLSGTITAGVQNDAAAQRNAAIRDSALVLAAFAIALLVVFLVARSLTRPLRRLRDSALKVAHEDLEREIAEVRAGHEPGPVVPIPVQTTEEVGQVAHAVDELHTQALLLAGDEARLRLQVNDMFETLSRRNRSLVDQQLSLIDRLERNEDDPDRLHSLFRLDHLAARMRRNGANLLVLAGAKVARELNDSVSVATAVSAAASEVEDYQRVEQSMIPETTLTASVTGDVIHLLAELIDNALRYSPPTEPVRVTAVHTSNGGLVVEIVDSGIGMTDTDLRIANMRLASGVEVTPDNTRHMGLFVVGRLAQQHGITVRLKGSDASSAVAGPSGPGRAGGTTVEVYLPTELQASGPAHARGLPKEAEETPAQPIPVISEDPRPVAPVAPVPSIAQPEFTPQVAHTNGVPADGATPLLPRRSPGASGIAEGAGEDEQPGVFPEETENEGRADASAFFSARTPRATPEPRLAPVPDVVDPELDDDGSDFEPEDLAPDFEPEFEPASEPSVGDLAPPDAFALPFDQPDDSDHDPIYQKMLSEWLVDPVSLASSDRDWKSVWDSGWTAAEYADDAAVNTHTDHGLPVREPGLRLVPGTVRPVEAEPAIASRPANGVRHAANGSDRLISDDRLETLRPQGTTGEHERNPEAVRASISNHFGGVRAGRSHARDTDEGVDAE